MSTCSTGSTTSSILPLIRVIAARKRSPISEGTEPIKGGGAALSVKPLASTIFWAWSMMLDMSTCECETVSIYSAVWRKGGSKRTPMTFFAPAFAANMHRIPVPHPTSRTTLSLMEVIRQRVLEDVNPFGVAEGSKGLAWKGEERPGRDREGR